jgi:hypothetical protein
LDDVISHVSPLKKVVKPNPVICLSHSSPSCFLTPGKVFDIFILY